MQPEYVLRLESVGAWPTADTYQLEITGILGHIQGLGIYQKLWMGAWFALLYQIS